MRPKKKIAVIVRDRKKEALRMALGLTLLNDDVCVFIMDEKLEMDEDVSMSLEGLRSMNARIFTNCSENPFDWKGTEEIALSLVEYDAVIAY
ncbi:MAG: hypothetical protein PVJ36_03415 [Nitrospirota bacterium]|jgi:hypothetical protein